MMMQFSLLTISLALVCGLQAHNSVEDLEFSSDEDPQEFFGTMYSIAVASDNEKLIEPKQPFRTYINSLYTEGGNLKGHVLIPNQDDDNCQRVLLVATPNGLNSYEIQYAGDNTVTLKILDETLVLCITNTYEGKTSHVYHVMAKTPQVSQSTLEKFKSQMDELGCSTVVLDPNERCNEFRS